MTNFFSRTVALALVSLTLPLLAQAAGATVVGSARVGGLGANVGIQASTTVSARGSDAASNAKARADQEIDRRITGLNALVTRIDAMQKIDATFKASLAATVQAQITDLTNLKATIDADSSASTLKVEVQSITKSYRIYALVMPQATIGAAADRTQTLVGMFTTLGQKLQTRIASSTNASTVAVSAMADFNAKVADAQVQATAAVSHIAGLQPDNGNKTVMQNNQTALKQARADIRVAQQDFVAARKDAQTLIEALGGSTSVSASSTLQTP